MTSSHGGFSVWTRRLHHQVARKKKTHPGRVEVTRQKHARDPPHLAPSVVHITVTVCRFDGAGRVGEGGGGRRAHSLWRVCQSVCQPVCLSVRVRVSMCVHRHLRKHPDTDRREAILRCNAMSLTQSGLACTCR